MTPREYLLSLELHGIKLGLDNITRLLRAVDNPQCAYPTIHIAGTNGKGSVAAMVDAMLQAAGYVTGRFTSPHLIDLHERFLCNSVPVSDRELDQLILDVMSVAHAMAPPPTFFEVVTAVAFRWFQQHAIDIGVIEVGMGGRFDSTNVILPLACAITNIDLEHTKYLGDTLEKIAFEKAGIIKPEAPVVVSEQKPGPQGVILARAAELNSPVKLAGRDFEFRAEGSALDRRFFYESPTLRLGPVALGLSGSYQSENAATAVAIAETLTPRFPNLNADTIASGLSDARWPCRLERVLNHPPVIIDVAHNAAGARKLAQELPPCVVVLAVSSDKDAAAMAHALAPICQRLIVTEFTGSRALPAQVLSNTLREYPNEVVVPLGAAIDLGLSLASESAPLLITGSIFAAGAARADLIARHGAPPLRF